jgi:hypothetical protein
MEQKVDEDVKAALQEGVSALGKDAEIFLYADCEYYGLAQSI